MTAATAMALKRKTCTKKTVRNQVAGLVEVPCVKRNVVGAVNAVACANMALSGIDSAIPCDEVINAIQAGILTSSTKERLEALEAQKKDLETKIAEEKLAKPVMKEEFVRFWLLHFRKLDLSQKEQRQALIDTFINAIYLYDDKVLLPSTTKKGRNHFFRRGYRSRDKEKSSDIDCLAAPKSHEESKGSPWDFCFCGAAGY